MYTSKALLSLMALAASSFAIPTSNSHSKVARNSNSTYGPWEVTNFSEGCSPGGCSYSFNISYTAPTTSSEPSFNTFCNGTDVYGGWQSCEDPTVFANEFSGSDNFTMGVQHGFEDGEATFFVFGNYTIDVEEPQPTAFEIVVTEVEGVE